MARILSHIISAILHPLLVPTVVYYLILGHYFSYAFDFASLGLLYFLSMICLATCVLPSLSIYVMSRFSIIKDVRMISQADRLIPNVTTTSAYLITYYMLRYVNGWEGIIVLPLLLMSVILIIHTLISYFWKISAHATSAAALLGFWGVMHFFGPVPILQNFMLAYIVLSGALLSARLYLGRHTPAQVWTGALLGFTIATLGTLLYYSGII